MPVKAAPSFRRMIRRPFALALVAGMLLPALVVAYLLWQGFVQQIDESHRKRLFSSLNILELVISKGLEDYRAALLRLAADNTLQVTMGLDIRPQMRRYLRTQFELSDFEYIGVFDLDGNEMVWVGDRPESAAACQSFRLGNGERLAVAEGRLFLERLVTVSQQGQALGRLCAGLALNSASLAAVIAPKVDGEAFLYWKDQSFGLNASVDRPALNGLGVDGQLLNIVVAGAKYHAMAQSLPIANQLVKGVVLVNQDEYASASRESLQVVGLVLLSVLLITAFGLRMFELRRKAERQLLQEREKAVVTLASIADGVLTTDPDGHITYANPAAEQLLGRRDESVIGAHLYDALELTSEVTGERLLNLEALANRDTEIRFEDAVLRGVNGRETPVHCAVAPIDRASPHSGSVITFRDVHRERELRRRLAWKASRDDLTGLLNRSEFRRGLKTVIADTRGTDSHHCLLYIDLDEFKAVNDTCGHRAGDDLLRQVSASLLSQLRQADVVARLGGDEFGVILQHCSRERGLEIAGDIIEIINDRRFQYQNRIFHVGASIGMVSVTRDTEEIEDLLATVDAACYAAKERGRNRVFVGAIDSAKILHRMDELSQASNIRQAIKDNRLVLYRQSIVPTSRPSLDNEVHAEVLVRMLDEEGGLVAPGAFIPIAERHGLMQAIDRWVVTHLFETEQPRLQDWEPVTEGLGSGKDFVYSINLSGASLTDPTFLDFIRGELQRLSIPGGAIAFEITETQIITHLDKAVSFIQALKALGCRFLLDDFGSGMSSFGYLKRLPVDYLKIDGLFVKDILSDPIDRAMVKMINEIGHTMGLITIAEYVENPAILAHISKIGVDMAQGFGISVPVPLLEERRSLTVVGKS